MYIYNRWGHLIQKESEIVDFFDNLKEKHNFCIWNTIYYYEWFFTQYSHLSILTEKQRRIIDERYIYN